MCRYTAEARDRYLAWFALEGHGDPDVITRLSASLGWCPGHTRDVMSQSGAATRLTAVYRYLLEGAREKLRARKPRLAGCPACEHDRAADDRALDALLTGLPEPATRERYLATGGLCLPHARAARQVRRHRQAVTWAVRAMAASLRQGRAGPDILAGAPDLDADRRAALWAALPPGTGVPPGACRACLAAARAQREALVRIIAGGGGRAPSAGDDGACLCGGHLRDAVIMDRRRAPVLLQRQAAAQASALAGPVPRRPGTGPGGLLRTRPSRPRAAAACPACRDGQRAARQELRQRSGRTRPGESRPVLCVRHVLAVRAADPGPGRLAAELAGRQAGVLLAELAEAFRKSTWEFRAESPGPEAAAWLRAAAFLDGSVYEGCPPPGAPGQLRPWGSR